MSDYVHRKVVRIPFPKEILEKYNTKSPYDCEEEVDKMFGGFIKTQNRNGFELDCSEKDYYIDWVYYDTYGKESGDWGSVRLLSENELNVITPYFDKLGVSYEHSQLRVVDYCYYNCCEPTDYYELTTNDNDHSGLFIN